MTRAEQAALKAYPECAVYNDFSMEFEDINGCYRAGFEVGYEQAGEETIERACKWLFSNLPIIVDYYFDEGIRNPVDRSEFIKSFRTQMEEEQ